MVDTIDVRRNKVITELNRAKLIVYDARTGSEGFILARRLAGLDLVIVSSDIGDMDTVAFEFERALREARADNTPTSEVAEVQARNRKIQRLA